MVHPVHTAPVDEGALDPRDGPLGGLTRHFHACYTPPEFATDAAPGIAGAPFMSAFA
jgi:hypothetical protein